MSKISDFVKYQRKKLNLTQEELADKAGVGIRFIRDLESGKETIQLDKVDQVLALFGFSVTPDNQHLDPYYVRWHLFNIAVKITLIDKSEKYGIIIQEIITPVENKITAWKFVPNNHAIQYQQKPDDSLTEIIQHASIRQIVPQ
jgi:y4mF family transcriptional regulator